MFQNATRISGIKEMHIILQCLIIDFSLNWIVWAISAVLQTEKFYDLIGCGSFVILGEKQNLNYIFCYRF